MLELQGLLKVPFLCVLFLSMPTDGQDFVNTLVISREDSPDWSVLDFHHCPSWLCLWGSYWSGRDKLIGGIRLVEAPGHCDRTHEKLLLVSERMAVIKIETRSSSCPRMKRVWSRKSALLCYGILPRGCCSPGLITVFVWLMQFSILDSLCYFWRWTALQRAGVVDQT